MTVMPVNDVCITGGDSIYRGRATLRDKGKDMICVMIADGWVSWWVGHHLQGPWSKSHWLQIYLGTGRSIWQGVRTATTMSRYQENYGVI